MTNVARELAAEFMRAVDRLSFDEETMVAWFTKAIEAKPPRPRKRFNVGDRVVDFQGDQFIIHAERIGDYGGWEYLLGSLGWYTEDKLPLLTRRSPQ